MYNLINKLTPDTEGVSKEELQLAMDYAKSFLTGSLRFPDAQISPQIKSAIEKLANVDIAAMKKWTRL